MKNKLIITNDLDSLNRLLPEIDIKEGISYCADDEDFYLSMVNDFANSARNEKLDKFYLCEDWDNYKIEVHSLKSASKMIGLLSLSQEAFMLEKAVNDNQIDFIKDNHSLLINHFCNVSNTIKDIMFYDSD